MMSSAARRVWSAVTTPVGLASVGLVGGTTLLSFNVGTRIDKDTGTLVVSRSGDVRDWFEYKFRTKKDPDAIVDFYSTEVRAPAARALFFSAVR